MRVKHRIVKIAGLVRERAAGFPDGHHPYPMQGYEPGGGIESWGGYVWKILDGERLLNSSPADVVNAAFPGPVLDLFDEVLADGVCHHVIPFVGVFGAGSDAVVEAATK